MEVANNFTQSQVDEKTVGLTDNTHDKQGYSHQEDVGSGGYADESGESGEHGSESPVSFITIFL